MQDFSRDLPSLMEKYRNELLQLKKQASVPPVPKSPAAPLQETPAAPTPETPAAPAPETPVAPAPVSTAFTAPLQVRVSSANEAIPVADALVNIYRVGDSTAIATRTTNQSGLTEPVSLPAVDPALTLQPNTVIPSVLYNVTISAPAHYRTVVRDIPLYGGIPTLLPVSLIPLPEFVEDGSRELEYDTPPLDL